MIRSRLPGPSRPPRIRRRGLFWLAALLSSLAVIGGGFVAISAYTNAASPESVAIDYFAALADGNAPRALSYGAVPDGSHAYLTSAVLREQLSVASMGPAAVVSVVRSGATARVGVSYQLHFKNARISVSDVVPLVRRHDQWRLVDSAVVTKVALAQAFRRALLAHAAFPDQAVALFPGALPITFDTPNLQVSAGSSVVHFSATDDTGLAVVVSPAGIAAVRASVGRSLDACLTGSTADALCPVPDEKQRAVPGSLRGTLVLKALPTLLIGVSPDANGMITVEGFVSVNGHYQALDFNNIASTATGADISVPISAQCYATSVGTLAWTTS